LSQKAGLIVPALPFPGSVKRHGDHQVRCELLATPIVHSFKQSRQRPAQARVGMIFELVNDILQRSLEIRKRPGKIELEVVPPTGSTQGFGELKGGRRESVPAANADLSGKRPDLFPTSLANQRQTEVVDHGSAQDTSGGK